MMDAAGSTRRNLVLAGMICAVSMTFIDQTIVSIAAPVIQAKLGLTATGVQWAVNGYLVSMAALFAFGGKLSDTMGHTRVCVAGIALFAFSSAMCAAAPSGSHAEIWLICFRVLQGAGGAIMYPATIAIVASTFPLHDRGKKLAAFFGIAGALTAVGPELGGILTQWTWRAIFLVNIPFALVALVLIAVSKPTTSKKPAPMDYRGLALIASGVALSVIGFQQSSTWGWGSAATWACIVVGLALIAVFVKFEHGTVEPLINIDIFRNRAFLFENVILFVSMMAYIPLFFFMSEYSQISLGSSSAGSGLFLMYFFIGFMVAAQVGGRMLDKVGAKRPVVVGCGVAALGFALWAMNLTNLHMTSQAWCVVLTGLGMGLMLGPSNTDAVNRASSFTYGEATGITQTMRNYGSSLGMAVLGTVLVTVQNNRFSATFAKFGLPKSMITQLSGAKGSLSSGGPPGMSGGSVRALYHAIAVDFAQATQFVMFAMCGIMAVCTLVALVGLRSGRQEETEAGGGTADTPAHEPSAAASELEPDPS